MNIFYKIINYSVKKLSYLDLKHEPKMTFNDLVMDLLASLRNPKSISQVKEYSLLKMFVNLLKLLVIGLFLTFTIAILIVFTFSLDPNDLVNEVKGIGPLQQWTALVIIAPVIEEIIFRLPLRYKPFNLALSTFLITFLLINFFISGNNKIIFDALVLPKTFLSIVFGFMVYLISKKSHFIKALWTKQFNFIYWISFFLFSIGHMFNYSPPDSKEFLLPLLALPHFVGGAIISYIRIKYGFVYGLIFHSLNNFAVSLYLLRPIFE